MRLALACSLICILAVAEAQDVYRVDTSSYENRDILLSLFQAAGGFRWTNSNNWIQQGVNVCDWYGITCYPSSDPRRSGEIQEINLRNNNLVGTVPALVFQIPYLESINLDDNPDVDVDFAGLGDAEFLRSLDISNTRVNNLGAISNARALETLRMSDIGLRGPFPTSLLSLRQLSELNANDNAFTGTIPPGIGDLTFLRELYLDGNDLGGQIPEQLQSLSLLEVLTLSDNAFGGNLPNSLESLTNLKTLVIDRSNTAKGQGISGSVPRLNNHPRLTKVNFAGQRLSGSLDRDFLLDSPSGETVEVDLRFNQISGAVPDSLFDKQYLVLYLTGNSITSVPSQLVDPNSGSCPNLANWMNGDVASLGCDAFLCRPGTWAPEGRATRTASCSPCNDDFTTWGLTNCASSTLPDAQEKKVLISMYNALGGRNWKSDDNWLNLDDSVSVCELYGISCTGGQVSSISLRNNGLIGVVPAEIFSLRQLQTLNLESNAIQFSFRGISSATNLRVLNLASTNLDVSVLSDIDELSSLPSLRTLSIGSNNLGGNIPAAIYGLTALEELVLEHCGFTGALSPSIGQLANLRRLRIEGNALTGQVPPQLGNLVNLQELSASENKFGGTLPNELDNLTNLQSLSLEQFVGSGGIGGTLPAFENMGQLTSLQLGSNALTGSLPPNLLSNSRRLDSEILLDLKDNMFEGEIPSQWSRFDKLVVELGGNRITSIPPSLCQIGAWMGGEVQNYQCDAILCPQGTSNTIGRQSSTSSICESCSGGGTSFLGAKSCDGAAPTFGNNDGSEGSILADFFVATLGGTWRRADGWEDGTDPCSFFGVECNGAGRVIKIDLTDNDLQGTVPSTIFQLPQLNELRLSKNAISVDFTGIEKANSLATLGLSDVNLASIDGLGRAPNLVTLTLAGNDLEGEVPREIYFLTDLHVLDLGFNHFNGKIPNLIGAMTNLEILRLYHNKFTGRLPASLGDLTNLKELNLAENNFEGTIPESFNDLKNLQFLSLQREGGILGTSDVGVFQGDSSALGPGLSGPLPALDQLTSISDLYLGVNSFSGSIPSNFLDGIANTVAEVKVDLTSNRLEGVVPASLTQFENLSLYLGGNRITEIADGLCNKESWLNGDVGQYQCDGILCPAGTYNAFGRRTAAAPQCLDCPTDADGYLGSFECLSQAEQIESSERKILEKFFREMNGENWLDRTNWMDTETSICSWYGIKCVSDDNPSVVSISLENNRLAFDFVTEIYNLPNLQTLNVEKNDIRFSFDGIQNAASLEYLDIAQVGLTTLSGVSAASGLRLLRADSNNLETFPNEIFGLADLEILSLSENPIYGNMPDSLPSLGNLKYFACQSCQFYGPIPAWIGQMVNLERLQLGQNGLTGALPQELLQLVNLKELDLSDQTSNRGGLSGPLLDFATLPKLTDLLLARNSLEGSIPPTLLQSAPETEFITLDLRYNSLSGEVPAELARFGEMNLYLAANSLNSLPNALCNKNWNDGNVGVHGCDGILCSVGSFNAYGRAIGQLGCEPCGQLTAGGILGRTVCGPGREHEALVSFYESSGGPSWTSDTNWLTVEDHCTWEGITCHTDGEFAGLVQKIELESNNLKAIANLDTIWELTGLEVVNLQKNEVLVLLGNTGNAINLQSLILSETIITSLEGISGAVNLKELHLTNCKIPGRIPEEIFSLYLLEKLYLSHNSFTGTLSTAVGNLENLTDLYVFDNSMTGSLPSELGLLADVVHMSLGENMFTGSIPSEVGSLEKLEVLSIEKEGLMSAAPISIETPYGMSGTLPSLEGLFSIRELYLGHNKFTGTIPSNFLQGVADKSEPIVVDLFSNLLNGTVPEALASFERMNLELGDNQISSVPDAICEKTLWFNGEVANGCDAILCPAGTFNEFGRRVDAKTICEVCTYPRTGFDDWLGRKDCGPSFFVQNMTEIDILEELFDAAGGSEWAEKSGWMDDSVYICEWYGVTCEPVGDLGQMKVTEITLTDNNLGGFIPSIIFHLPELRKLDVRDNSVGIGLNAIFQAKELQELYLDRTQVTSLEGIGRASSLRVFHAQGNSFGWSSIPEELFDLTQLEDLDLSDSLIGGTLSTNIGKLGSLERLSLFDNALSGQIPSDVGNLFRLGELDLSNNNWFGTLPETLNGLNSLKTLAIENDNRGRVGISGQLISFRGMPNLREIRLSNNQFTGTIPTDILFDVSDKTDEIKLFLDGNHLVGTVPSQLAAFQRLEINLQDNLFTSFGSGLCDQLDWMGGNVGQFGCDAILCPAGFYNAAGRQTSADSPCAVCPDAEQSPYLGASICVSIQKQREFEILSMIFDATDGNNWRNNDGWKDNAFDICRWYGIKCNDRSTVESILLGSNRLVGTIPSEVFQLQSLKFLWVYSNHVDLKFDGIEQATSLTSLLLDSTKISTLEGIGNGLSLVDIDVRFNNLSGPLPVELSQLSNLESLTFSENDFSGKVPELTQLRKLTTLRMGNNKLTGTLPSFAQHPALQAMDLSQNSLVGSIPKTFLQSVSESQKLFLDLSGNKLTGTIPGELSRFPDLTIYLRDKNIGFARQAKIAILEGSHQIQGASSNHRTSGIHIGQACSILTANERQTKLEYSVKYDVHA